MGTAIHHGAMMQEASRLAAADGRLETRRDRLCGFLTPPGRPERAGRLRRTTNPGSEEQTDARLARAAAERCRQPAYEPLFDKHVLTARHTQRPAAPLSRTSFSTTTGKWCTYGECANVSAVNDLLPAAAQAMTLKYPAGRQTAVAHLVEQVH